MCQLSNKEIAVELRKLADTATYTKEEFSEKFDNDKYRGNYSALKAHTDALFVFKCGTLTLRCKNYREAILALADRFEKGRDLPNFQNSLERARRDTHKIPKKSSVSTESIRNAVENWDTELLDQWAEMGYLKRYVGLKDEIFYIIGVVPLKCDPRFAVGRTVQNRNTIERPKVFHIESGRYISTDIRSEKDFKAIGTEMMQRIELNISNLQS